MKLLSLNDDALFLIASLLDPLDALRLSETSQHLYLIALPQALSAVTLMTHRQLSAFCKYMLKSSSTRMHLLRELAIVLPDGDFSDVAPLLADVLEQALGLRSIIMHHTNSFIKAAPRIGDALVALEGLTDLRLLGARELVVEMLPRLRSRPSSFQFEGSGRPRIVLHLSQLSALQNAVLIGLVNVAINDDSLTEQPAQWEALQHLSLEYVKIPATFFLNFFPNLENVALRLDEIVGLIPDAPIPSPSARPVRGMMLNVPQICDETPEEDIIRALRALQCVSPLTLSLKIFVEPSPTFWTRLVTLSPQLRYLDIELDGMSVPEEGRLQVIFSTTSWLCTIPPLLANLNIVCLRISLADTRDNRDVEIQDLFLQHMCASLRYIAIESVPLGSWQADCGYSWWSVEGSGDTRRLVAMSSEAGEAIHESLWTLAFSEAKDASRSGPP
ncbi:hypothetical protein SCP_1800130 [Sparassis crispa]|uniref:F-box domain-containing protein n=1 Tax=Sparassis crispa TaxID=139825 RepID=A0A401H6I2_9APHY|nr:hypothetical protein SCP_1800130 [Sparassis crispa]GBE89991.1 hypothetical protein SCP_1800130 [Sparassis crispa]